MISLDGVYKQKENLLLIVYGITSQFMGCMLCHGLRRFIIGTWLTLLKSVLRLSMAVYHYIEKIMEINLKVWRYPGITVLVPGKLVATMYFLLIKWEELILTCLQWEIVSIRTLQFHYSSSQWFYFSHYEWKGWKLHPRTWKTVWNCKFNKWLVWGSFTGKYFLWWNYGYISIEFFIHCST